jgi:high-affinity Fe2+/Pb2+ permease
VVSIALLTVIAFLLYCLVMRLGETWQDQLLTVLIGIACVGIFFFVVVLGPHLSSVPTEWLAGP